MADLKALMAKKKKEMEKKQGGQMSAKKPTQGKFTYRILPAWRKPNEADIAAGTPAPFWHDFGVHWVKKEENGKPVAVHICNEKTYGESCEICNQIGRAMVMTDDDDTKKVLKACNAKQSYLMNALRYEDGKPGEPFVLEVGQRTFDQIVDLIDEYDDITDLKEGTDIVINRSGTGFDTEYTVMPAKKSKPVSEDVLGKLHDLDVGVDQTNSVKHNLALEAVSEIAGIMPPKTSGNLPSKSTSTPKTKSNSQFSDDASVSDAEYEEIDDDDALDEALNGVSEVDDDIDEVDDILGDLDEFDDVV